jgi:glycosyltransferase involved in cell wall biosynthesis
MELTTLGLDVVLVPNPETIRKSEIYFHQNFPRVLCTTRLAEKILNKNNISNTFWIGHGYGNEISQENRNRRIDLLSEYARNGEVILTHIAGYNHKRKMTCEIIKSLAPVLRELPGFKLRILSQIPFEPDCYKYASNISNLEMVNGFLSHNDVMDEYRNASFSLQLSTHEGLGLGFYESISCGTPVITIDKEPHNEAIIDGQTGILIKARDMTLYDNDDALIKGGIFNSEDLAMVITKLTPELALELSRTCMAKHKSDLSLQALSTRMTAGLQPFI